MSPLAPLALAAALLAPLTAPAGLLHVPAGLLSAPPVPPAASSTATPAAQDTVLVETGGEETPDTLAREPVPAERVETDREATEELRAIFTRLDGMEGVEVEVEAGVANLEGLVASAEDRERAADLARGTEGVRYVNNRVRVESSLSARLESGVQRIRSHFLDLVALLPLLGVVLLLLAGALFVARSVGRWDPLYGLFTENAFAQNVLRQVVRTVIVLIAVLTAVELLEMRTIVGAVVGTAGVAGLALGFAFKEVVENYLAGLIMSVGQPFAPHDHVRVGEAEGKVAEGKVVRLTSRETILLTLEGNHLRIPNATILRSLLTNYTRNPLRRFEFEVSIGGEEDPATAQAVVREALAALSAVLPDPPPTAQVTGLGDSWTTLTVGGWIDQRDSDFLKVRSEAIRRVKAALEEAEVDTPPPQYRVVLERAGRAEEAEQERPRPERRAETAEQEDVSPDPSIDRQIEEDRRTSEEEDLLE